MTPRRRLLILGPLGPPHVEDQAAALAERDFEVIVGGNALEGLEETGLEARGIPVHESPAAPRGTPWGIALTTRWTRRLYREVRPDVVQAHWLPGFGFAAAAAGAKPLAVTAWGSDVHRAGRAMRAASSFAVRRADLVLADAADLIDGCVALGAPRERTALIQWGVDLATFTPASEPERSRLKESLGLGPGPVIMSPRSLMPVYNIPTILEAFATVGSRVADAQLLIKHMGEGSVQTELPPPPHPDRVRMVGNVPYERMADFYRVADVVVSVATTDGSPRSVWEAMACGAACVLTDLPWFGDMIVPGENAVAVPVKDAPALAAAILSLLDDPGLRSRIAAGGRALVRERLDREAQMDRLAELLHGLTDNVGASPEMAEGER